MPRCGRSTSTSAPSTWCDATARRLGLTNVNAVLPADVPDDVRFATIWSNPPIRVGKQELHAMLEHWLPRLDDRIATRWLVVANATSAPTRCSAGCSRAAHDFDVARAATHKGFRVLRGATPLGLTRARRERDRTRPTRVRPG